MAIDRTTPIFRLSVKLPGAQSATRVSLDDNGLSRLKSLTYEDTEKGADKAKIEIDNYDLRFPDDPVFDRGNLLYLQWGYPGNLAPERELVITDWLPGPTFVVEAKHKAILLNREQRDETYDGLTYSKIAQRIAERAGYGPAVQHIETTTFVVESIVQAHETDAQLLRRLAKKLGFVFFVDQSGFHFHPAAFGQAPRKVLAYFQDGLGELLDYPSFERAPARAPGAVTLKGKDPITKKPIEVRADDASTKGRPGMATQLEVIDKRTGATSLREAAASEVVATTAAQTPEEAKAQAAGLVKRSLGIPVKCSAVCRGDPQFLAKTTVELRVDARLSGIYYCQSATHTVSAGEYTMTLKLARDGTNGTAGLGHAVSSATANVQKVPAAAASGGAGSLVAVEAIDARTGATTVTYRQPGPSK